MKVRKLGWVVCLALCVLVGGGRAFGDKAKIHARLAEAQRLYGQAMALYAEGRFAEAVGPAKANLAIIEEVQGPKHPDTATSLFNLGVLYASQSLHGEAEPLYERALAINEEVLGPQHPVTATLLNNLAGHYAKQGLYGKAEPLYERALAIYKKVLGSKHPLTAASLNHLAELYRSQGLYGKAEPLYGRALAIREEVLGPKHPDTATSLNNLGVLYQGQGLYVKAESLYERALVIYEEVLGPKHPGTAGALNNLAELYRSQGLYVKAESLYERALAINEEMLGPKHPTTGTSLNNMGLLYQDQGLYVKAESLSERALAISEEVLGPKHPGTAVPLNNLAKIYQRQGLYAKAEPLFARALAIYEEVLGPKHPNTASALDNLAQLYQSKGFYVEAEPLVERALAIREEALGPKHPLTALSLNNLARNYENQALYAKAKPLYERALAIREEALGPQHPETATSLNDLGGLYFHQGLHAKAVPLYERALAISEEAQGPKHPDIALALNNLAVLYKSQGLHAKAVTYHERAEAVEELLLSTSLASVNDERRSALVATLMISTHLYYSLDAKLSPGDTRARSLAVRTALRRKARVQEATAQGLARLREGMSPATQDLFDTLSDKRSALSRFVVAGPSADMGLYITQRRQMEAEVDKLETELARKSATFAKSRAPVTIEAVQAAIPLSSALIEFAWYLPNSPEKPKAPLGEPRYSAYILRRSGQPALVDLGPAAPIDKASELLRVHMADDRAQSHDAARDLYDLVIGPLMPHIGDAQGLIFSPDGQLGLTPLHATKSAKNLYLLQTHGVSYLTSGRDLLRYGEPAPKRSESVVIANPAFGAATQGNNVFSHLPGTVSEAAMLKTLFPAAKFWQGKDANEEALKALEGPEILHMATHGGFLKESRDNPLFRARLALAGANTPSEGQDGILTAYEAQALDLVGTKLVVLSACETGVGDVRIGEGIYGLRRAFVLAGAESLAMSLWKVDDAATQALMRGYYEKLLAGAGRAEALRLTQIEMLKGPYSDPKHWASFSLYGNTAGLDGVPAKIRIPKVQGRGCAGCGVGTRCRSTAITWLLFAVLFMIGRRRRERRCLHHDL